jgi:predicted transcriptional regulator
MRTQTRSKRLIVATFATPAELLRRVDGLAKFRRQSRSALLRELILREVRAAESPTGATAA